MIQYSHVTMVTGAILLSSLLVLFAFSAPSNGSSENRPSNEARNQAETPRELGTQTSHADKGADSSLQQSQTFHPPKAVAGEDQTVREADSVKLNGKESNDQDGDSLKYKWELVSPKNLQLRFDDSNSAEPTFVALSLL